MRSVVRWMLAGLVVILLAGVPIAFYRAVYTQSKRLRVVSPGQVYRSGQMTAEGFAEAVHRYHIRTIINLQDEYPNPDIARCWIGGNTVPERELCRQLGVRYVFIAPDLIPHRLAPVLRPEAIERFLAVMDDPESYPVLIHCRAGLHRTGVIVAVYRMEYEGWSSRAAMEEVLANGFGRTAGTAANDYISQYVLMYQPGFRQPEARLPRGVACPWRSDRASQPVVGRAVSLDRGEPGHAQAH